MVYIAEKKKEKNIQPNCNRLKSITTFVKKKNPKCKQMFTYPGGRKTFRTLSRSLRSKKEEKDLAVIIKNQLTLFTWGAEKKNNE